MRSERKYKVITVMALILTLFLLGTCIREPFRMRAAESQQREQYIVRGASVYAAQCVQCHAPRGEGSVGMPLNRQALKGDERTAAGRAIYDLISQTTEQGRPGNLDHAQWERLPDGKYISYTGMAAWGRDFGGPLDVEDIRGLALFIMKPEGDQWSLIGDMDLAPLPIPDYSKDDTGEMPLPNAKGVDAATNEAAKALLRNTTKSQCLSCHMIGSRGGLMGPDLTLVGKWGVDQAFIEELIKYTNLPAPGAADKTVLAHDKRIPVYWSQHRAITSPALNLQDPVVSEGPYFMTRFKDKLTDEEISLLARYLVGLK